METFVSLYHDDVVVTINGMHRFSGTHKGIDAWIQVLSQVPERYEEIKLTYGYMISNYKSEDNAKIVIFIDEHSDGITKNGGTGKSVISESIKYFKWQ